jgi:hypothetical protein
MAEVHTAQPAEAHQAQTEATPQDAAQQQEKPTTPAAAYLGDNLIPDAEMVYDQKRTSEYFSLRQMTLSIATQTPRHIKTPNKSVLLKHWKV